MTRHMAFTVVILLLVAGCRDSAQGPSEELTRLEGRIASLTANYNSMEKQVAHLKEKLATLDERLKISPSLGDPANVKDLVKSFLKDLQDGRNASAYASMSLAYQKKNERNAFNDLLQKNLVFKNIDIQISDYKFRKLTKDKCYECDVLCRESPLTSTRTANIVLRVIEEDGVWKIDDIVEIKKLREY